MRAIALAAAMLMACSSAAEPAPDADAGDADAGDDACSAPPDADWVCATAAQRVGP
jgi:hypothetical protein